VSLERVYLVEWIVDGQRARTFVKSVSVSEVESQFEPVLLVTEASRKQALAYESGFAAGAQQPAGQPGSLTDIAFGTGAIAERTRIIKLLTDLGTIRRDALGDLVAFNTEGTEVIYLTGLEEAK
jgi:hypothetical protein